MLEVRADTSYRGKFLSVAEQIWQIAEETPEAPAIRSERGQITFRGLTTRASALAGRFKAALTGDKQVIAIATDDGAEMICAALAAWRAGCAYLPLDPAGPSLRLEHMLAEAQVNLIATAAKHASHLPPGHSKLIFLDECGDSNNLSEKDSTEPDWTIQPGDPAYVIYTSGSTGLSKGVVVTHANLAHLVRWHRRAFSVSQNDRGTQFAALSFDAAVLETWPLLAVGASLCMPDRSIALAPDDLRDYLVSQRITLCFAATPLAEQMISLYWPLETSLRYLLTGADTLHSFPPAGLPFQLVNNYGPTECTVLATSGIVPVERGERVMPSIGNVIPGAEVHLLDAALRPVPDGERGQICIGGAGVGAGYVGRPELTAERFISVPEISATRLYLTGDLGRRLPSGELDFCGRMDDQIKLRGFRIEPAEVEMALRSQPTVAAAVVASLGTGTEKQLTAYVVLKGDVTSDELRRYLQDRLPSYMIPTQFVRLDRLPLTASGKIDRSALPAPDSSNTLEQTGSLAELETEIQREIGAILSSLLGGRELGLNDNFFLVGGHSLLAAQIMARIRSSFQVDLPLRTVFESSSIAALSKQIETRIVMALTAAAPVESARSAV